jgi:hypothetical protein
VKRILAFALLAWPLAASAEVPFFCSFESSPTDCGFREQAKVAGRAMLVDHPRRHGAKAVRLYTEPGDTHVSGSGTWERNDLKLDQATTGCYEGAEQWWAHSTLFPSDWVPSAGGLIMDFHHTGDRGQANFNLVANSRGLSIVGFGGAAIGRRSDDPGAYKARLGPIEKNVWYDFVYHVKWSSGSDGFMYAWVNGVQKLAHRGPTLYSGMGCYLKLANYHSGSGSPSAVIHDRVVRGSSAAAVSLTPLR